MQSIQLKFACSDPTGPLFGFDIKLVDVHVHPLKNLTFKFLQLHLILTYTREPQSLTRHLAITLSIKKVILPAIDNVSKE